MGWIEDLYETYERQPATMIGKIEEGITAPLLPICHTTNKAQIEITIDHEGSFRGAKVVDEATIIPCTEKSSGRTNGSAPHPLGDKLQYIAKDYSEHCDSKEGYFCDYRKCLVDWGLSEDAHPKVIAVMKYVEKGNTITDLIRERVLFTEVDGKILEKWKNGETTPEIFKVHRAGTSPSDSFVRWRVEIPGSLDATTWSDESLWKNWEEYYTRVKGDRGICFVTGEDVPLATQHPAKIRNAGDKAKLISSNDGSGFTYRGRFTEANQVAGLSFEVTQKAHSALRWLISRQGFHDGDLAVVAWAMSENGVEAPDPLLDTFGLTETAGGTYPDGSEESAYTGQDLALRLGKMAAGYRARLGTVTAFVVMCLDSATPGRMAIKFYHKLEGSEYLSRITKWHESCAWRQNFGKDRQFFGAPSPRDIAEACYGRRLDEKLRKATIERLLPCIVDGAALPKDIVESATRRTANRLGFENAWEWEKALGIACALFRKYHESRGYTMALEEDRRTRDYLYGRLLAVADVLEGRALRKAGETRPTSAARLMQRFADHPCSTWKTIWLAQTPYKARIGWLAEWFNHLVDEIEAKFTPEDFISDKSLGGEFLLGYHCQRAALNLSKQDGEQDDESSDNISTSK